MIDGLIQALCAAVVGVAVLVAAAAAQAGQTPVGDEPYGPGYRMQPIIERSGGDPYQLYVIVKVSSQNGKLKVCGVLIADMSDRRFNLLQGDLIDRNSFLRFGAAETRGYRARPSFLAVKRAVVSRGGDGRLRLPLEGLRTNCIETDADWEDRFAAEPFSLGLRRTTIRLPGKPIS
ncbi:MAG: hypothetical protein HY060_20395 [Proteobacteria bacterium]|nr:hypothetical protein [Pseudomonadota bacterium]